MPFKDWTFRGCQPRKVTKDRRAAGSTVPAIVSPSSGSSATTAATLLGGIDAKESETLTESKLCSLALRFTESRVLTTAVELGLFTVLTHYNSTGRAITEILGDLQLSSGPKEKSLFSEFLRALVSLHLLRCDLLDSSSADDVLYFNTLQSDLYLVKSKGRTYLGDTLLVFYGSRPYQMWSTYQQSLLSEQERCPFSCKELLQTVHAQALKFQSEDTSPNLILRMASGFIPSQVMLTAYELGLVHLLDAKPLTTLQIHQALCLECRLERTVDFLTTLVDCGVLAATQVDGKVCYANRQSVQEMTGRALDTTSTASWHSVLQAASTKEMYQTWATLPKVFQSASSDSPEQARSRSNKVATHQYATMPRAQSWVWSMQNFLEQRPPNNE